MHGRLSKRAVSRDFFNLIKFVFYIDTFNCFDKENLVFSKSQELLSTREEISPIFKSPDKIQE